MLFPLFVGVSSCTAYEPSVSRTFLNLSLPKKSFSEPCYLKPANCHVSLMTKSFIFNNVMTIKLTCHLFLLYKKTNNSQIINGLSGFLNFGTVYANKDMNGMCLSYYSISFLVYNLNPMSLSEFRL